MHKHGRLAQYLHALLAEGQGIANPDLRDDHRFFAPKDNRFKPAAILMAFTDRPEPGMIFIHRPTTMRAHAGQVAFPGGRIDHDDKDAIHAALREAEEELALPPNMVDIIGTTDCYYTGSGYAITPVIGVIPPDLELTPNAAEVDSWFEAPVDFVMNPENCRDLQAEWQGEIRQYSEIMWQDHRIWGVTAGIIRNLRQRVTWNYAPQNDENA